MFSYKSASLEYERYLSEPPMSEEEWLEEYQKNEEYMDLIIDNAIEEMKMNI